MGAALLGVAGVFDAASKVPYSFWTSIPVIVAYVMFCSVTCLLRVCHPQVPIPYSASRRITVQLAPQAEAPTTERPSLPALPGPVALPQLASVLTDALSAARSITEESGRHSPGHHRGGTGSHRPGPRRPAHRRCGTHRPVHHDENSKASALAASRGQWQPPTRTARNASPSPSPTRIEGQRRSPASRGQWPPPTRTAPRTHRPVHHRRLLEGSAPRRHRGGTGGHRPGPRRPAHRRRGTHRPVHHR